MINCPECGSEMFITKERQENKKVVLMLKCEKCWSTKYIEFKKTENFVSEPTLRLVKGNSSKNQEAL